jgi:hypothetical protein
MVYRILWLSLGGKKLHLLKLAGALFLFAAILKVAEAAYNIFVTVNKVIYAQVRPELVGQLFGWSIGAPYTFSLPEDAVGVLMGPVAAFLFWVGVAVVAIMVYQAGRVIVPVEEYEQRIREHHRTLIEHARKHVARRR